MSELKTCDHCICCKGHRIVKSYYFTTNEFVRPYGNEEVLSYYINMKMDEKWELISFNENWAIVKDDNGNSYEVYATVDNHRVDIITIEEEIHNGK